MMKMSIPLSLLVSCLFCLPTAVRAAIDPPFRHVRTSATTKRNLQTASVGQVIKLRLINSVTDAVVIDSLTNGTQVPAGSYSIEAITQGGPVQSVRFGHNGNRNLRLENKAPWAMCLNNRRDFFQCKQLGVGTHTVSAMAYSKKSGRGSQSASFQVTFIIGAQQVETPLTLQPAHASTKAPASLTPTRAPIRIPTTASPVQVPVPVKSPSTIPIGAPRANDPPSAPVLAPVPAPTFPTIAPMQGKTSGPMLPTTSKAPVPTKPIAPSPANSPVVGPNAAPAPAPAASVPLGSSPVVTPTKAPSTKAPVPRPTTKAPQKLPTKAPIPPPTLAPVRAPTKAPLVPPPTKSPTRAPMFPVAPPTLAPLPQGIVALRLIHVPTNTEVMDLVNGTVVDTAVFPQANFNIRAVPVPDIVKYVQFMENGRIEGTQPFAWCSDSSGIYESCSDLISRPNAFTVTVAPFDTSNNPLQPYSVNFQIVGPAPTPTPPSPSGALPVAIPPAPTFIPPPSQNAPRWIEVNANAPIDVRHEACFVMVNNPTVGRRAYLVGGRNHNGTIKDLDIYNPITRTWTKGMRPPVQLHHMQCVAAQGKLWIVAAWTAFFPKEKNADHAYVYDPATNLWHTKQALPPERRRGSSAVVVSLDQSKIYVSHGTTGGHETANFSIALGYLDVYDIATNSWTALSDNAPHPRDHTGGALINGRICVAGGRNGGELYWPEVAPTVCYDLTTGQWHAMAPIPQARAGASYGTTCDGKLMIAGGEGSQKAWSNVDIFDGTGWTTVNSLVVARHGSGLAVDCVCNQIHIASGARSYGGGVELQSIETYFPTGVDVPCAA